MSTSLSLKELNVLFVEDDITVQESIQVTLNTFCNNVQVASNGQDAIDNYDDEIIDIVITDVEMPKASGFELIKYIRGINPLKPVVIVSGYSDRNYLYNAVNLGIQGYIIKPVNLSKIKRALEQSAGYLPQKKQQIIQITDDIIYKQTNSIVHNGQNSWQLGKKEKLLLDLLLTAKNNVVTYSEIEESVWNEYWEVMTSYALRTVIKNLRKKVGKNTIINISGHGYKIKTYC